MKMLLLLVVLSSCSGFTEGSYKKKYHLTDYTSTLAPAELHARLKDKMEKCYVQSEYPVYEKTVAHFDAEKNVGVVSYEIDNQGIGPRPLVLVEILAEGSGSQAKIYAKGDVFRPAGVFQHQIHKWIQGQKVDCQSRGDI